MAIKVKRSDTIILSVNNADNQVKGYLNGREIYAKSTEDNPTFHDQVTITTAELHPGYNVLLLVGSDWGGTAHYKGSVTLNGMVIREWDDHLPAGHGIVWDASLEFELKS